ncbi:MAG: molybdopterin-dependent oxidoreductase [Chloroflexi bacterium]|nr:molybdopterin-dependent oxidoreductase [Chloroflexota bacterium]
MADKIISSGCSQDCGGRCVLKYHVKDGVITRIETDDSEEPQLRACLRGRAYRQKVYAPERLLYPMKRAGERGEGRFERISWDEALDKVASALKRVKAVYGPAAIHYILGSGDGLSVLHCRAALNRLLNLFGGHTPRWGGASAEGGVFANRATFGTVWTGNTRNDHLNSKLIILWAWNPLETIQSTFTGYWLMKAKEKGIRFVCVDPRFTDTCAALADQWIPIRPGADTAMLVAMANVIVSQGLHDRQFIERYTVGFEPFRDYILGAEDGVAKTPEWAEPITGVPAGVIRNLAIEYATTKPAALIPAYGPGRSAYGEQYHRATAVLAAITGNIGIHGGNAAGFEKAPVGGGGGLPTVPEGVNPVLTGFKLVKDPLMRGVPRPGTIHTQQTWDAILTGRAGGHAADIKLVYAYQCNPLNAISNSNKGVAALKKLEFLVVQDMFMTATARFADILLPAGSNAERNDIARPWTSGAHYIYNNKVIEPLGESKPDFVILTELAARLGLDNFSSESEDEWLRRIVKTAPDLAAAIPDYDEFKQRGYQKDDFSREVVAFEKQIADPERYPFPTPSGKIEIYCQRLADLNDPQVPPIPKYLEPWESPIDPLAKKYPLQLITPHLRRRAHSVFDNVPWLRELQPQMVWINAADAAARDIRDGDEVKVFNERGAVVVRAKVTQRIMPGVVAVPEGAWFAPDPEGVDRGGCANTLTSDRYSPGGAPAFNTGLVQCVKA